MTIPESPDGFRYRIFSGLLRLFMNTSLPKVEREMHTSGPDARYHAHGDIEPQTK